MNWQKSAGVLDDLLSLLGGGFVGFPGVLLALLPLWPEDELRLVLLQASNIFGKGALRPVLPPVVDGNADGLGKRLGEAGTL